MANRKTHIVSSIISAITIEIIRLSILRKKGFNVENKKYIKNISIAGFAAVIGGLAPDVLEPATNSNHRSLCHSWGSMAAVCTGLSKIPLNNENNFKDALNVAFRSAGVGYASHLAIDSTTPKGLPLLIK